MLQQFRAWAYGVGPVMQGAYHTIFWTDCMMAVPLHIQVCMCRLSKDSCGKASIFTRCYQYVQKGYGSIWSWFFCSELDVLIYGVYVVQETLFWAALMMTHVSSTYLFHIKGGCGDVFMALISKSSMYKFATMGLIGEPIAAPSTCSKNFPWKVKYVLLRQNSKRQVMLFRHNICLNN